MLTKKLTLNSESFWLILKKKKNQTIVALLLASKDRICNFYRKSEEQHGF